MSLLLDAAYVLLLLAVSPLLAWRSWRTGRYRRGWGAKLLGAAPITPAGQGPVIWLHAVSVGEVNLLQPLVERLEAALPGCRCVISTTTDTGMELASKKYPPRDVFYCPLDFSWAVRRAVRRVRPDLLVLAELELWPNLVSAARRGGARVAVVNGRLSERSARGYGWIRPLVRALLRQVDCVAAQTPQYAERFLAAGAPPGRVAVTGSVKFDGACRDRGQPATRQLTQLACYDAEHRLLLAGSTQAPEEELAVRAFLACRQSQPQLRLMLVPRHPERSDEVAAMVQAHGLSCTRRSELREGAAASDPPEVLLVDVVGELGAWWGRADIAYVGGSMGSRGGQNMIEPAAYGCPVSFGPRTRNFRDVVALLLQHEAAVVVEDGEALTNFVRRCLEHPPWAAQLGERGRQLVVQQQGAADRTVELLAALLPSADARAGREAAA